MATGKATTAVQPCRGGVRLDPGDSDHESTQVQDSGHGEDDDIATSNDDDNDDGQRRQRRTTTTTMDDNDRRPRWTTTMEDNDNDGWGCDDGGGQSHSDAAAGLCGSLPAGSDTGGGLTSRDPYPYPSHPVAVTRAGYPNPCHCLLASPNPKDCLSYVPADVRRRVIGPSVCSPIIPLPSFPLLQPTDDPPKEQQGMPFSLKHTLVRLLDAPR
ncbi:hypothetical protein EDB89DRAFT_1911012 [Lactarius sanguifluus]|nr:hypothetical protein EDB89DRAFT_1911012 [Lactarius sanguifluus]